MAGRTLVSLITLICCACAPAAPPGRDGGPGTRSLPLADGWEIQASALVLAPDAVVGSPGYPAAGWLKSTVPATVVGAQVTAGLYGDPFYGMNLRSLPGIDYPIGGGYGNLPMSPTNPFHRPWWYRTEFTLPPDLPGSRLWLQLAGVNYRAEVYLNGQRVADGQQVVGTFRRFELDVTGAVRAAGPNALALKVSAQELTDLGWNWVDWSPSPPDKDLGLWRDVTLIATGPVRLRWPQVTSQVELPGGARAALTVSVEAENGGPVPITAVISGQIETRRFSRSVALAPGEVQQVRFTPEQFAALQIAGPRLWWPAQMGPQELYDLSLRADVDGRLSDQAAARFGVRAVSSELTAEGHRLFRVNGLPVLIRGAGFAPDMFLRVPQQRLEDEIRYVRDMNLNALRLEGKVGFERLYELSDQYGILLLAGWCCCDQWEMQDGWSDENRQVALGSLRDQARLLLNHPSAILWMLGSDNAPPPDLEQAYADVLSSVGWPNPLLASANSTVTPLLGSTGLKMPGPYMWVPPVYWATDQERGGAFGFNTETSTGAAIPPLASLRRFLPPDHLWPPDIAKDASWTYHSGSATFVPLDVYLQALAGRHGAGTGVDDFARKSQLMAYEGVRAMFEAYGRNKYRATGVIQWMLDNAWPGLIWHLYDYYLRPGGGYFGAQRACEQLHVQFGYDDRAVVVVNGQRQALAGLSVAAQVLDMNGVVRYSRQVAVDVAADGVAAAFTVPEPAGVSGVYFLRLVLSDPGGAVLSRNFYWLSTTPDVLDPDHALWYYTPTSQLADYTGLAELAPAAVAVSGGAAQDGDDEVVHVTLKNNGPGLAFFVRAEVAPGPGADEVLPVRWDDNYVSLVSGEQRELTARLRVADLHGAAPVIRIEGWNVPVLEQAPLVAGR